MTRPRFGNILVIVGYVALLGALVLAAHHPAIIMLLVVGTGAFFFGRWFQKSG